MKALKIVGSESLLGCENDYRGVPIQDIPIRRSIAPLRHYRQGEDMGIKNLPTSDMMDQLFIFCLNSGHRIFTVPHHVLR